MKDYINMQMKNLVSNRDTLQIGKILVFKFPNDFGIKNKQKFQGFPINYNCENFHMVNPYTKM